MFRRKALPLSEVLQIYMRENGLETPLLQRRLISAWGKVAGPVAERFTTEAYIRQQTLFVRLMNASLRADLYMNRSSLVDQLNAEVGSRIITDIRFI